ncbi:caspase family protein [Paraburkholderia youngii]|uniref:caspase family protein n=1 Tax=Paraburkholderia youngii TaxID=2782701 RepID=UPI003D1BB6C2
MSAHALLIGVTRFSDPELSGLRAPRSDVEALKAVLEDPARGGFSEVIPSIDEDLIEIRDKLSALLDDRGPKDMVLLYYSGHGVVDRGNNLFLATGETRFERPRARSLPSSEVREMMQHSRAGKVVVILDCCHSGVFTEGIKGKAEAVNANTFDPGEGAEGYYVLTATTGIQYALDSQTAQPSLSHFTSWLVDGLGRGEAAPDRPFITLDDLWSYVSRRARQSEAAMTPSRYVGRNSGVIVIARNPAAQPARIPTSGADPRAAQAAGFAAAGAFASQNVPHHPPYPAEAEDVQRAQRVRAIALDWRAVWSTRTDDLAAAIKAARAAERDPAVRGSAQADAARRLASEAGSALSAVPMSELECAEPYGLHIHRAVRGRMAIDTAMLAARVKCGADITDEYVWENVGRVLESALSLARFDVGALPLGFDTDVAAAEIGDLRAAGPLILLRSSDASGQVALMAPLRDAPPLARLAARRILLTVLAARLSPVGTLEMVATDTQYVYGWWGTTAVPTHQRSNESGLIAAAFIGRETGAPAVIVERNGDISFFGPNQAADPLSPSRRPSNITCATVWTGADAGPQDWRVLLVGSDGEVVSVSPQGRVADVDLFDQPLFRRDTSRGVRWRGLTQVTLGLLEGFHCALVLGNSWSDDHAIFFVDPVTLRPLRAPLVVEGAIGCIESIALAGHRWLLATTIYSSQASSPRLLIFDLSQDGSAAAHPIAGDGVWRGDLYQPLVVLDSRRGFSSVQIKHEFDVPSAEPTQTLLRYDWPERRLTPVCRGNHLRSFLVADSAPDA